ncbi:MAG: FAD-dependent oxidoreductase [Fuerstiella sp.]|nr:FAD-dependent oxidoreductase [Fuerstiella sp.]
MFALLILLSGNVTSAQEIVIWQEAESLSEVGGWSNDSQHVDIMGSPYLLATGVGRPVADAIGKVTVTETSTYRLWVRCRDWYPSHSPGRFSVSIGGRKSSTSFGKADADAWQWIDGGDFELVAGDTEVRVIDRSGWWGRCDTIVLATGDFTPANEPDALAAQRLRYAGVSSKVKDVGPFDVVVVGAGSSGLGAAIAAARNGIRVAFVQDRPVLGGNSSSEIMVPPMGLIGKGEDRINVTGIAEELYPPQGWTSFADSVHLARVVARESNISLFLNTRATGVEMFDKETISAVLGLNVQSGQRIRFRAPLFIDTTGHGWIGFYAGAEWRMGTEARSDSDETMAPEKANTHTMGNSLYRADFQDVGRKDPFETPAWAYQYNSPTDFRNPIERTKQIIRPEAFDKAIRGPGRPISSSGSKRGGAFTWYIELGGMSNTIEDAEKIRDELFRLHVGLWGYAKNYDPRGVKSNRNLRMVWLNYVPGVRESRRLVGDYLMTQKDFDENQNHPDVVAFTDWGIDDHQPHGYFTQGIDAIHVYGGKRTGMPYRSFYSRNIDNLFMAGRCMSASHMALGGVRVQRPMAATGQVVGTAAAIATKYGASPRGIHEDHLVELQQTLVKDGCYIPGVRNSDPDDLARTAGTNHPALVDGWNREITRVSRAVPWRSDPIEFQFAVPKKIACVHLSLANRHNSSTFAADALVDGEWKQVASISSKFKQRRYVFNFDPIETKRVRFRLIRSSAPVAVTEIRIYSEPGRSTEGGLGEAAGFPSAIDNVETQPKAVAEEFPGIVADDLSARRTGKWIQSTFSTPVVGGSYLHDDHRGDGAAIAIFNAKLPRPGIYEVRLAYAPHENRASNVPVTVTFAGGTRNITVNQRVKPPIDGKFISLGMYAFEAEGAVSITNVATDGYVIADGVQWLPVDQPQKR